MHALAGHRIDGHAAAQLAHLFMYHVHADATPGDLGDFFGRGKPGLQDELQHLTVADACFRVQQATQDGFAAHGFQRHSRAIVVHVEYYVAAFIGQFQADQPLLRLAAGMAHVGRFQAMVDGIAQHMLQGRNHAFQNVAIDLGFGIDHAEFNLLAQLAGNLAHHPFEARQYALERHHARAHQALLQLRVHPRLFLQQPVGVLVAGRQGRLEVEQIGS